MTLLIPVIMTAAFLVPAYIATHGGPSKAVRNIAILDASNSGLGQRLADALMADSALGSPADSVKPRVENVTPATVAGTRGCVFQGSAAAARNRWRPAHHR